jgi:hypothetical protein
MAEESVDHREGLLFEVRQDLLGDVAASLPRRSAPPTAPSATDLVAPRDSGKNQHAAQ